MVYIIFFISTNMLLGINKLYLQMIGFYRTDDFYIIFYPSNPKFQRPDL
ncbi:hypothetical protein J2787_001050 [Chryseobacterium rhizosphaerae]|uniref:Uncharacterized protein n=1 Tax=Chryseobacterium rhizosphaerae TaxID=395937 RepID=A0AAE4C3I0_9FLAO|nr:hypothetical protein [Chryseobacterium rhizosphaerae]